MSTALQPFEYKWVRSCDGMLAGVCAGLGRRFGIDPWVIRLLWLASVFALGTGLLLYVVLAVCLPREDRVLEAQDKRILGVCAQLSQKTGLEVGVVRTLAVLIGLASFGLTVLGYVILYFAMPDDRQSLVI